MARRPSADFRERLVTAVDAGLAPGEAATHFRVSIRTIYRWLARHRRGEALTERSRSGRPPKLPPARYPELRALVLAQPDATLPEHAARLEATTGIRLSPSHLSRLLTKLDLPLKKRAGSPPNGTRPPALPGGRQWPRSIRRGWSFSMRRARPRP